jgi:hypothetical protein
MKDVANENWDNLVSTVTSYGLDNWSSIPTRSMGLSLDFHIQTSSGTHQVSCPKDTRAFSFPWDKAAGE